MKIFSKSKAHLGWLLTALGLVFGELALPTRIAHGIAPITVTNSDDSDPGSLRAAIRDAVDGQTILFDNDYTIILQSPLTIDKNLTIDGSGHSVTVSGDSNSDGTGEVMVFWVNEGFTFNMKNLAVTKGSADYGGGIRNYGTLHMSNCTLSDSSASHDGGGIYNAGTLTATNCTFSGNSANQGGGIQSFGGSLTLSNCTFSGNSATYRAGGVYNDDGTAAITNTTFSENSAILGGGIFSEGASTNIITNSTFSGNTSSEVGSGGNIDNLSGNIVTLRNTIIALDSTLSCTGGNISDLGNNIDSGESCIPNPVNSSMKNTDPLLGDLANNGGPTQTFALLAGSPAIDAGDDATCSAAPVNGIDQRGVARPQGAHCDIGAYEKNVYRIFLPLVNR